MIVEWHQGTITFLEPDETYQVSTNFVGSAYLGRDKPCWRYNKAVEILESDDRCTLDHLRNALEATHVTGARSATVYSFICDLTNGEIRVYNFHDFSRTLTFELEAELLAGPHEYYLGSLFTERSDEYEEFIGDSPARMIEMGYGRNVNIALMFFNLLKARYPEVFQRALDVDTLIRVGKNRVEEGDFADAVKFLEANTLAFPESAKAHYELGAAYVQNGQMEKAAAEYEKTLAIDEDNLHARRALEDLR